MKPEEQRPKLKRPKDRKRRRGRRPLEDYTDPEDITPQMEEFCRGIAAGNTPAQVGAILDVGQQQIEAWLDRCPAVTERIKQLQMEREIADKMDFWVEMGLMTKEIARELYHFMIRKIKKDEVSWADAKEIFIYVQRYHGLITPPRKQTAELTTEEVSSLDMIAGMEGVPQNAKDVFAQFMDPKKVPAGLPGSGGAKKSKKQTVKLTKEEG